MFPVHICHNVKGTATPVSHSSPQLAHKSFFWAMPGRFLSFSSLFSLMSSNAYDKHRIY